MKNPKLLAAIVLASFAIGGLATAGTMEVVKKTGTFKERGNTLEIGANSRDVLCPKGGVFITMHDEHAIEFVSFYCMNDATVDKVVKALEDAKVDADKIRSLN